MYLFKLIIVLLLKPGFHYPSWRPELTGDRFPLPVNTGRVDGRSFPLAEFSGRQHGPSTRLVETGLYCYRGSVIGSPTDTMRCCQQHLISDGRTTYDGELMLHVCNRCFLQLRTCIFYPVNPIFLQLYTMILKCVRLFDIPLHSAYNPSQVRCNTAWLYHVTLIYQTIVSTTGTVCM